MRDAQRPCQPCGDLAEALPRPQPPAARQMHCHVAVAEIEPLRLAQAAKHLHRPPALIDHAPAARGVVETRRRITDGTDVRADRVAKRLESVPSIYRPR